LFLWTHLNGATFEKHLRPGVDALAIHLVERPRRARTEEIANVIQFDYNDRGKLVAVEVLDASRVTPPEALNQLSRTGHEGKVAKSTKCRRLMVRIAALEPPPLRRARNRVLLV
jgi:YD repeat-containing protein